jgi:4'-phosphopantetheinyl transferase
MPAAQGTTRAGRIATLRSMIWLTSPDLTSDRLPAVWIIPTGARPANLAERSALRRGTARAVLARQLGLPADAVTIGHDGRGRPLLAAPGGTGLHLSLATRAGHVAIALALHPVGTDIEVVDSRSPPPLAVLHQLERAALLALPDAMRAEAFARLWSAKEAYVKALGLGFLREPDSFCVTLGVDGSFTIDDPARGGGVAGLSTLMKNGGQEILAAAMVVLD